MILNIADGTVYDIKYYNVKPFSSINENITWDDIMTWCINTFGPSGTEDKPGVWTPYERWYANNGIFWFKDKKDLEWFVLKWQ
jgi:hypothetical protein